MQVPQLCFVARDLWKKVRLLVAVCCRGLAALYRLRITRIITASRKQNLAAGGHPKQFHPPFCAVR